MKEKSPVVAKQDKNSKENMDDLKKQTVKDTDVKKGYNEKNPVQPEGAFKPDNSK